MSTQPSQSKALHSKANRYTAIYPDELYLAPPVCQVRPTVLRPMGAIPMNHVPVKAGSMNPEVCKGKSHLGEIAC